jgi:uncharacterized damage-inducible protein DinB
MSELAAIIEELKSIDAGDAWHGPSLREALSGVTAAQAAAKPLAGAHSIWEIVSHIAGWENVFRRRLAGDAYAKEPEAGDFPAINTPSEQAWQNSLASLETEHEELLKLVSKLPEEHLGKNVADHDYSVRFLLHGIVRHHVYHTGQIALLRKAFVA